MAGVRAYAFLFLFLASCFNPDDILPVHGALTSIDPLSGQTVRLLRDPIAVTSSDCSEAKPFKETAVGEAGNYSFDVFRAQAVKLSGQGIFCFRVETTFPSGSTVFSDILGLDSDTLLPAFPDWRANPQRTDGVLHFEPVAPLPTEETLAGSQLTHRAEWFTEDGGLAWRADDRVSGIDAMNALTVTRVPMPLDDYALEDFSGRVSLRAKVTTIEAEVGPFGGQVNTIEARSGQTLRLVGARVPISRGLACPSLGSPCPLTDGDLTSVDAGDNAFFKVTLTLATPVPLSAVVVRGAQTDALFMGVQLVSADGGVLPLVQKVLLPSMWNSGSPSFVRGPAGDGGFDFQPQSEQRFFTVALDAGVPISEVTVGFAGSVGRISEVSLFE